MSQKNNEKPIIRAATHKMGSEIGRKYFVRPWYTNNPEELKKELNTYFLDKEYGPGETAVSLNNDERTIIGGVSPHAGYMYSGSCATFTYLNLFKEKIPDTVLILGNDHVGFDKVALMEDGEWETLFGNLKVDTILAKNILDNSNNIISDRSMFMGPNAYQEHNIEIQLPIIKYCAQNYDLKILPMKIGHYCRKDYSLFKEIARDLANTLNSYEKDVIIIASSDMTHRALKNNGDDYELFKRKDQDVIDGFIELNPEKAFKSSSGSVCGISTITTLLLTCNNMNATKAKCLKYYTSFDKTKDMSYCVGYFSGIIIK